MRVHRSVACLVVLLLCGAAAFAAPTVRLPRRLMLGTEVLREVFLQTGTRYAYPTGAVIRQIDATALDGLGAEQIVVKLAPIVRRRGGVLILEAAGDARRQEAMLENLLSPDPDLRRAAVYGWGCLKSSVAIGPLHDALSDRDESVRHHALRSLDRLERDFRTFSPPGRVSIFELAAMDPAKPVTDILKTAANETTHEWIWSAELLGRIGKTACVDELAKAAKHGYGRTAEVARWAMSRMQITKRPKFVPMADRRDAESLAGLMKDLNAADAETQVYAIRTLARRADADPAALLNVLPTLKGAELRAEMLQTLGRLGGKTVWDLLLRELNSDDVLLRRTAIRALARCPDPRAIEPLMKWLTGAGIDGDDRNLAAMTLGRIGGKAVVRRLSDYVASSKQVISTTALALGWTHDPDATPALITCLKSKKDSLMGFAFIAMEKIGTVDGYKQVAGIYGQRNNITRYLAHAAIRRMGHHQQIVDFVIGVIKAGRGRIAPHALEEAEDPRAVDALIEAYPKSRGTRLMWLIQALGRIGDPKAAGTLIAALNHEDANMRYQALRALRWRWFWHRTDVQTALKKHPRFKQFAAEPPSLVDQAENTWVLRHWAVDFDDTRHCNTTYEAGLVYCDDTGNVLKWGAHGQRCDTPQTGETWLYDTAKNRWRTSESPVEPYGMCGTWGLAYDRANRKVVSVQLEGANHAWQWVWGRATRESVPWLYDTATDQWTAARPMNGPGPRGFLPLVYHDKHQVMLMYGGQGSTAHSAVGRVWIYDVYTNEWTKLPKPTPNPGYRTNFGFVYLPKLNRCMLTGGNYGDSDSRTWLYELETNTWTDTKAAGGVPTLNQPVEYDPAAESVLAFRMADRRAPGIHEYLPARNVWQKLDAPEGAAPHYDSVDAVYDARHNLFVIDGGHTGWNTDHIGVRELWTYRHKKRPAAKATGLPAPTGLTVDTRGGKTTLTWLTVDGAAGYHVHRGSGSKPWQVIFGRTTTRKTEQPRFVDMLKLPPDQRMFYFVTAVDADGAEGEPSPKVRTQPAYPTNAVASVRADRTVELTWAASKASDVVGYHVYAARMKVGKSVHPSSMRNFETPQRLTDKPITATRFHDARKLAAAEGLLNHEVRGYQVRAVNAAGVQSGPSPLALTLTGSVPRVTAAERPDGSTLIRWEDVPEGHIRGYAVFRMDDWRRTLPIRLNAHPIQGNEYVDFCEAPRAERRRYYVVAIDALNQMGLPSTGAWAFGRP